MGSCSAGAAALRRRRSPCYPAVEVATALLVAGCVLAFGVTPYALVAAFFCAVLVVVSAIDLEHRIIPNRIVVPGRDRARRPDPAPAEPEWALAALGASGFLFVAAIAYPAGWAWATSSSRS